MSRTSRAGRPARLLIEALRLDREAGDRVRRRALEALDLGVGGFILFGGQADEVFLLLEELRSAAGRPLWLAADLERGVGQQFAGRASLPPPAALARAPDPVEAARAAGEITGREARELGINWVLAPVLDLDVTGENPIVGTRSFGSDPLQVARLGHAWIEACQSQGPAACAKHFPGHGRTVRDSHLELPVVEASPDELAEDLAPFVETADVVATVMVAHVTYPSLSPGGPGRPARPLPATRDPAVLRGLLRDGLGFKGLVASDALIMGGFADPAEEGMAAVEAVSAGCDLLLYPRDAATAAESLTRAADGDAEFADRLSEAGARSERLLDRREAAMREAAMRGAALWEGTGGTAEDMGRRADELADDSIVMYEPPRAAGVLATAGGMDSGRPVAVRVLSDDREPGVAGSVGEAFTRTLRALGWDARLVEAGTGVPGEGGARAGAGVRARAEQSVLLLASSPQAFKGRAGLAPATEAALREGLRTHPGESACLVALAHLRLLERLGVPGLCAWSPEPVMERAAARRLAASAGASPGAPRGA